MLSKQTCYSNDSFGLSQSINWEGIQFVKNVKVLNLQDNYKQNKISKITISYET